MCTPQPPLLLQPLRLLELVDVVLHLDEAIAAVLDADPALEVPELGPGGLQDAVDVHQQRLRLVVVDLREVVLVDVGVGDEGDLLSQKAFKINIE
uniref:Uncharacterized protein n=1 Tax=Oryza nivara TaxID=4536 RepID=A0A0E0J482_ORYNI